jgi:hypothetical protein
MNFSQLLINGQPVVVRGRLAHGEFVATVSEFLTVGFSAPAHCKSATRPIKVTDWPFGREEPAVRKALTAATSYIFPVADDP